MSVKIEILDYKYGVFEGLQMISNYEFTSSTDWDTGTGWSISGGKATHSGGNGYLENTNVTFIEGKKYKIICKINGMTQGNLVLANHLAGGANGFNYSSDGTHTYEWVQGSSNTTVLSLAGWNGFDGDIWYVEVFPLSGVDWERSVVGELDVTDHSDFPLAMTFQISDIKDLTSTSGDYSKTFKIPATKNNNQLLKNPYIANIDTEINLTDNKRCRILVNNLYSLQGLIKITGVGGYGETPSYYSCVFFGNNISWAEDLSNKYMDVIDWGVDSKDLAYNKTNIMATWQHEDCDAAAAASDPPIVYPITSYGKYNPEGEPRTIQLLDTYGDAFSYGSSYSGYYGFNNAYSDYGTPLPSPDWRPAIFIKDTLERIFTKAGNGYKINSTFMETDMFKKLVWLLPNFKYNNPDEKHVEHSYGNTFTGEGLISSTLIEPTNNPYDPGAFSTFSSIIDLNDAGADFVLNSETNNTGWDASTGIYTIQEYGYYTIELNNFGLFAERNHYAGGSLNVHYAEIITQVQTVGQTSWNNIDSIQTGSFYDAGASTPISSPQAFSGSINQEIYLNKGDKLRLSLFVKAGTHAYTGNKINLHLFGSSNPTSTTTSNNANGKYSISINPNRVEYGQTYDLKDVINTDYKQIDFVKGVAHAFNLQITTDENARVVNIEPFDTFYKDYAEAVDWTYRLDRSKQIEDKWIKSDLKRDVVFKYKSDSKDKKVEIRGEQYFNGIKDERPYQETLPKTFEKGESKYENPFFAGTYNDHDQDTTGLSSSTVKNPYSACLWAENAHASTAYRPTKGFEFLPRLLYWKKYSPSNAPSNVVYKFAVVQTWATWQKWVTADASANPFYLSNIYPQATSYNGDDISSPILSYGNVNIRDFDDATGQYASAVAGKGLFETYYKTMFEMLKAKPRLRTVYIDLKVKDIVNLDFTRLVYIDGVYWRINKVVDYQPNKNQSTKVELIEWLQVGTFAATAPPYDGGTDTWGSWNPDEGVLEDDPFGEG